LTESTIQFLEFIFDFSYTIILITLIAGFLYYRRNGQKAFFFTYVLVAAVVFQLCIMLVRIPMELGFAIGLFAIFGIIRYRTSPINPREMTYLLVSAGIAAKNALALEYFEHYKILASDALIVIIIVLFELLLFKKRSRVKIIVYNKLELIHEDLRPQLISDLETSFGIKNIQKIQVGKIDTVRNSAQLKVYFLDTGDQNFSPDTLV
jgi:hypothetical protein